MKICNCCKLLKSLDEFHNKLAALDGKQPKCKVCKSEIARQDNLNNPQKYKDRRDKKKEVVGVDKIREYNREYRRKNRDSIVQVQAEWRASNPDKIREYSKRYFSKNESTILEYRAAWAALNKDIIRAACARRRARKLQAYVAWGDTTAIQLIYTKARRLSIWLGAEMHVDHIVPLASKYVCGLHCEANLQILPAQENFHKHNTWWPDMWA